MEWVEVDADGVGVFGAGAGTDIHNMEFNMGEDGNYIEYESVGYDFAVDMTTYFDGDFEAFRHVYAIDLTPAIL